ncbi:FMN reductase [Croceivirga lutea]|uniref:NADPH-dependent FMN reductase n=1 Tax=Croceivirga lutea TaxID=1775167 RepID=UPI00163B3AD8|nr:NAD(P)H-dependent oxidoreductase [Croceivirga lutea]GGG44894.1 FMN reductase [Croceivirga lutea]
MKKIITLAASNSQQSINQQLISYTSRWLTQTETLAVDLNDYVLPIYGVDFEAENGIPTAVKKLDALMATADGFIISLAEHNGSYTAVFKNVLDWLSRVQFEVWRNKPMLLLATSPGGRGGATVLENANNYFPFMGAQITGTFALPNFYDHYNNGQLSDTKLANELHQKTQSFEAQVLTQNTTTTATL